MITRTELVEKYKTFFESKGHKWIPGASLVPENDPTVLFTTAGMHPLVPYLMGEPHAEGKRLANVQKCIRTGDIDEVGDANHHTFFEMLGNWSLGDYFKAESIPWSFEFITDEKWLNIDRTKLGVSVFAGDDDAPFDQESYDIWLKLGIPEKRIAKLPKSDNWWGPAGTTGPCGPDTEIFYWIGEGEVPEVFNPENKGWSEIWNNVFMQYNKTADGKYEPLKQNNVDTGMGVARTLAVLNGLKDNYQTELFSPLIGEIEHVLGRKYVENKKVFRIIADHVTAASFAIADGVRPSNKEDGYVVRKLISIAVSYMYAISREDHVANNIDLKFILEKVVAVYGDYLKISEPDINKVIREEQERILANIIIVTDMLQKHDIDLFTLHQTYGIAPVVSLFIKRSLGYEISKEFENTVLDEYQRKMNEHRELSRTASAGMFKGGLADAGEVTTKYHTATHLLQAALRQVLGDHVYQKGSNITPERLRFDFSHPDKMTEGQIKKVENIVNEKIAEKLPVTMQEMSVDEAKKAGALGVFEDKYGSKVKVYSIGPSTGSGSPFSREICGGPHVKNTGDIGGLKIVKEEASSAGVRRIKAVLTNSL